MSVYSTRARPLARALFVALLAFVLAAGAALGTMAGRASGATTFNNWPQRGYGPLSNYGNPNETIVGPSNAAQLHARWARSDSSGTSFTAPIVANTRVFVSSLAGELVAYDATTGQLRWHTQVSDEWSTNAAVRSPFGVVYLAEGDVGTLEAFDERTGASLWTVGTYVDSSQPIWANGNIFMRAKVTQLGSDKIVAYNGVDGRRLWAAPVAGDVSAVAGGIVFVSGPSRFTALRATTGAELWHSPPMFGVSVANSSVFGANGRTLSARDYVTGALRWSTTQSSATFGGTADIGALGVLYADTTYAGGSRMHAYSLTTGQQLWSAPVGGVVSGRFSLANGVLYVTTKAGRVVALNAASGATLTSLSIGAASTAFVVNGTMYVTTSAGQLRAFTTG
jgi:outer membrane protein assembly factor BamB